MQGFKALVFFLVVLTGYGLLHAAVGLYFVHALDWHISWYLFGAAVFSILGIILARFVRNIVTETIAVLASVWMGALFIAFIILFPLDLLRFAGVDSYPIYALPFVVAVIITSIYLARSTRVRTIKLQLRGLKKRVKLVQLTDLHIGDIYREGFLAKTVKRVEALNPDLVVITGDLFDGAGKLHPGMISALKGLHKKTLYVNGNHEVYEGLEKTNKMVDATGVTRLNDVVALASGIQFIGLSYPAAMDDKRETLKRLVAKCDKAKPIVLLRHEPRDIDFAATLPIDLQLSGHTHNGQIWPLSYMVLLVYKFKVGLHRIGKYTIYISPGTGTWGPPMRLGSRSEITVFELE